MPEETLLGWLKLGFQAGFGLGIEGNTAWNHRDYVE